MQQSPDRARSIVDMANLICGIELVVLDIYFVLNKSLDGKILHTKKRHPCICQYVEIVVAVSPMVCVVKACSTKTRGFHTQRSPSFPCIELYELQVLQGY